MRGRGGSWRSASATPWRRDTARRCARPATEGSRRSSAWPAGAAAVFHPDTISFAHAVPDPDPRPGVDRRFEDTAELLAAAFRGLGVDARVGEVQGEYCPGAHSVNAGGKRKVMGVGQRLIAGGVHVGGVVVVDGLAAVRDILVPVYAALGLDWRPETTGSVADEVPGHHVGCRARRDPGGIRRALQPRAGAARPARLQLAQRLAPEHLSPR